MPLKKVLSYTKQIGRKFFFRILMVPFLTLFIKSGFLAGVG